MTFLGVLNLLILLNLQTDSENHKNKIKKENWIDTATMCDSDPISK